MESKFLPDSVSGALKSFAKRATGALLVVFGIVAIFSLLRHNPYLDGFAAASTFGNQSVLGQIVGFLRYLVGFVPALFIFMVLARIGLVWLFKWDEESGAFYNLLRTFITICAGSAAFGLIAPMATYGGMFGAIVATDVGWLIGGWGILLGLLVMAGFFVMAATVLHIKWSHVQATASRIWRVLRWLASVFHLARPIANDVADTDNSDEETAEEDDEDLSDADASDDDEKQTKKSRASRKVGQTKSVAIPARATSRNTDAQYQLPDPKFLERSSFGKNVVTPELKQNAKAMEIHFAEYGVNGRVVGIRPGPIVTLYEFEPDAGTRIAKVNDTVKDMTRAMATQNIRIAHIPNTHLIGVEMVNLNRQTVKYRSLIEDSAFVNSKYKIPLALGVNIGGNPMYFDLAKMPHMLIAGRTGSGKSVFVQSIITSIVYHFTPDKCKLMIIDPKGVDFGFWDDIPHLITPIVKLDPVAAVNALKWAVREMDERYKRMAVVNARDFVTYNEIMAQKRASGEVLTQQVAVGTDDETGELLFETQNIDMSPWPYIVIVIDEVADLMALARKEVEACIQRIAQKARAAGIHLVMATQRPDATTITGVIKANFPTRISFQARSYIDSMTTLGDKGAEQLLACGDMLFSEGGKDAVRIHGAFISDAELTRIGNFLRAQGEPEYASGVTDGDDSDGGVPSLPGAISGSKSDKNSDLYEQAKEIVLRDKKPTISYLQRRLSIGYNKAAGFIERMEQDGIVSAPDANNKRHIL